MIVTQRTGRRLRLLPAWCLLGVLGVPGPCVGADLQLAINRESLEEGETFTMEIRSNRWETQTPDLSPLERDFEIVSSRQSQVFRLLQGKQKQENHWQIELLPRRAGLLRIPPIRIGNDRTAERFIEVRAAAAARPTDAPLPAFVEARMEPENPYVHAQAIYIAYLHVSSQVSQLTTSRRRPVPEEGSAQVEDLEVLKYQKRIGGQRYTVHELRYRVTPQNSGTLRLASPEFKARIGGQREWVLDWSDFGLKRVGPDARNFITRADALSVQVRPVPPAWPSGAPWLPARSLVLQAKWAEKAPRFAQGVPVTRLFEMVADGLAASQLQLPPWRLPDAVRVYPEQPAYEDRKHRQGSTGILRQGIALIPAAAGSLVLPAVEVPWWNVRADRLESARVPAATVDVAGTIPAAAPPVAVGPGLTAPPAVGPGTDDVGGGVPGAPPGPPWLSILLACAWLVTLVLWWRERRFGSVVAPPAPACPRPDPKPWVTRLHRACLEDDPVVARAALQGWARAVWPEEPPVGMAVLAERCPPLAEELEVMDRALYRHPGGVWRGGPLWSAFQRCPVRPAAPHVAGGASEGASHLRPLYP